LGRELELLIFGTGKPVVAHCTVNSHTLEDINSVGINIYLR
jgi:hypothetical protein